ncbi:hypothetical protein [Streptomyces sp. NBC_01465]|uniref:hypothetical protein n=1 Tax=Streptomyces sp. NBC_01465 TaxID=2903878 RepID=UPI002E35A1CC|nr:hypothetical protein [Streptomyces sp. NBC_01465]
MTDSALRPLLFVDVDGPLIPFGATRHQLPDGYPTYAPESDAHRLLSRLDPRLGTRLAALHHPVRALLHRVDPARGLTGADFDVLGAWLRAG